MPAPSGLWMNLLLAERADAPVPGCFWKDFAVAVLAAHRAGPDLFPAQWAFARGVRLLAHTSALHSGTCRGYRRAGVPRPAEGVLALVDSQRWMAP